MAKVKRKNPADHLDPSKTLTKAETFFIENNMQMSIADIATTLGKPRELIQAYADKWVDENPPAKEMPRGRRLLQRSHGTVGMTGEASMAADERRGQGDPRLVAIEEARRAGRVEEAKRLREEFDAEMELRRQEKVRNKYNQIVHYIIPPDEG